MELHWSQITQHTTLINQLHRICVKPDTFSSLTISVGSRTLGIILNFYNIINYITIIVFINSTPEMWPWDKYTWKGRWYQAILEYTKVFLSVSFWVKFLLASNFVLLHRVLLLHSFVSHKYCSFGGDSCTYDTCFKSIAIHEIVVSSVISHVFQTRSRFCLNAGHLIINLNLFIYITHVQDFLFNVLFFWYCILNNVKGFSLLNTLSVTLQIVLLLSLY